MGSRWRVEHLQQRLAGARLVRGRAARGEAWRDDDRALVARIALARRRRPSRREHRPRPPRRRRGARSARRARRSGADDLLGRREQVRRQLLGVIVCAFRFAPVSEPFLMSAPVSEPFLTFLPVISTAAVAVDERATTSAATATTIDGAGKRRRTANALFRTGSSAYSAARNTGGACPDCEGMFLLGKKTRMVAPEDALSGRPDPIVIPDRHFVLGTPLKPPFPEGVRDGRLRHGLLLGRRARVLAGPRRLQHGCRATPAATPRTRPTKRSAPAAPGTPRPCSSCSTPTRSPTRSC